jgi:diguanylate cyclase (GGDEF)-like protein
MRMRTTCAAVLSVGFLLTLAHVAVVLARSGQGAPGWLYLAPCSAAVVVLWARVARVSAGRLAWGLVAAGVTAWVAADAWWIAFVDPDGRPVLTLDDILYTVAYALVVAGIAVAAPQRAAVGGGVRWLAGGVAGLAVGAVVAAALLGNLIGATNSPVAFLETAGFAVLALVTLTAVAVRMSLTGWYPGAQLATLGAGIAVLAITDLLYMSSLANGGYVPLGMFDTLWPIGFLLCAVAAAMPADPAKLVDRPRWRDIVIPGFWSGVALMLLVAAGLSADLPRATTLLAGAAVALGGVRAALIFREHLELLARSRAEARVDQLSGLPNRRAFIEDLDTRVAAGKPTTLAFFDLDGFKVYNDSFGHAAGDALLQRLGDRLSAAVQDAGQAYRLGGDEFCVLLGTRATGTKTVTASLLLDAADALRERGDGFAITASVGSVSIPEEVADPREALRLADQRMYARKAERRGPMRAQASELLLAVVRETEPDLDEHNGGVTQLVREVATHLGLADDDLDIVVRGAQLHDVGKVAVPDEILHKPAALNDEEWQLMRQHTIIGERILMASPGTAPVASLVRSSHERWDGGGYPDGLRGQEIPLGARIIAVCDAFDAIISDRPYAQGRSPHEAIVELERCAGSQFDPRVVAAFVAVAHGGAMSRRSA